MSTSPNLTVTVTPDTAGRYICQAVVQGFPEVSAEAAIMLKGPPKILSQRIQLGSEGDTVRLECLAVSIPRPERVTWSHLGHEIDTRKYFLAPPRALVSRRCSLPGADRGKMDWG